MTILVGLPKVAVGILAIPVIAGCQPMSSSEAEYPAAADKITFDLDTFDENGLYGPPDGQRSLDYEFCIPSGNNYTQAVTAIDPSLSLFPDSPGRIGCTDGQTLAIGNTYQQNFKLVLMELANLDYVERIQRVDWE